MTQIAHMAMLYPKEYTTDTDALAHRLTEHLRTQFAHTPREDLFDSRFLKDDLQFCKAWDSGDEEVEPGVDAKDEDQQDEECLPPWELVES
ncbi:hypothetical protein PMZ80_007904 [Knufia obscura]|uniref:Uncharacterized protein n=1 Tax=Knufia obscura TaxID=1635080 RepID=A0ABR0RFX3_9EURO|nr:hypothetical protein PMZ80_007904 [Knufia obscura]